LLNRHGKAVYFRLKLPLASRDTVIQGGVYLVAPLEHMTKITASKNGRVGALRTRK
jgi:hypothetical protein